MTEFRLQIRLSYALRPDLTLESYAEPYISSGRFTRHGELVAARSSDLRRSGTDGTRIALRDDGSYVVTDGSTIFTLPFRDFNVRSLRSNPVLRWEWTRGCTLFVVWQQDRFHQRAGGERIRPWMLGETVDVPGDNFLALKLTYWLGM